MKYPEWAPPILVNLHASRTNNATDRKFITRDPETELDDILKKYGSGMTDENIEQQRRYLNRISFFLPDKESTALLEQLITNTLMKDVWKTLSKRIQEDREYLHFFGACEGGIMGWRGDRKQTTKEKEIFFQEIADTSGKLLGLLHNAGEYDYYSTIKLRSDKEIKYLLESLDSNIEPSEDNISYARFTLSDFAPSMIEILSDIADKAREYSKNEPIVKKPNSTNAEIHYFVRRLSDYFQSRYSQPLHEAVAVTTSVIFDQQNIDTDYVRKLVKR